MTKINQIVNYSKLNVRMYHTHTWRKKKAEKNIPAMGQLMLDWYFWWNWFVSKHCYDNLCRTYIMRGPCVWLACKQAWKKTTHNLFTRRTKKVTKLNSTTRCVSLDLAGNHFYFIVISYICISLVFSPGWHVRCVYDVRTIYQIDSNQF